MNKQYKKIKTADGTDTLYNSNFNQHYHSVKEGALTESLLKHIIPAISYQKDKKELNILDICYGLGFNTLATIYYIKQNNLDIKLNIYSPEFDKELLNSLKDFSYPKEFDDLEYIIKPLYEDFYYKDKNIKIEIYQGDARQYIKILKNIDIVYQDAFSSDVNKLLWTQEYFCDISKTLSDDAIITTYSIATPVRLSMFYNDLNIYEYRPQNSNKITIALNKNIIDNRYKYIDMKLKLSRNITAKPLRD